MRKTLFLALLAVPIVLPIGNLDARDTPPLTDSEIRQQIIQQSAYLATGHPCACPYNSARNRSSCGGRSVYSRPGGAAPLCHPSDVTDGMVSDWKRKHACQSPLRRRVLSGQVTGAERAQLL
jgi:hypothetical protein